MLRNKYPRIIAYYCSFFQFKGKEIPENTTCFLTEYGYIT